MFLKIVIYVIIAVITQILTYKLIRHIDLKERKKLRDWENEYIKEYAQMWKEAHFDQLVIEEKIEQIEAMKKEHATQVRKKIKEVKVNNNDIDIYDQEKQKAEKRKSEQND